MEGDSTESGVEVSKQVPPVHPPPVRRPPPGPCPRHVSGTPTLRTRQVSPQRPHRPSGPTFDYTGHGTEGLERPTVAEGVDPLDDDLTAPPV